MSEYEQIQYQVAERVLTITLNRPERMNAFTGRLFRELLDAFDRADADDEVRAIVVTGAGRAFCAGADLERGGDTWSGGEGKGGGFRLEAEGDTGGQLTRRIFDCHKPVIAAINGAAVGVGITMTLAMDMRLAAEGAKLGFVFARRGIVPEACSAWFLPRVVGISKALEWSMSGRIFRAEEALEAGLVRSVHPADQVYARALELAREIADNCSATSVALTRHMMWKMLGADHPVAAHRIDTAAIFATGRSADAKEGIESFLEKRPPDFKDRVSADMPDFFPWWETRRLADED